MKCTTLSALSNATPARHTLGQEKKCNFGKGVSIYLRYFYLLCALLKIFCASAIFSLASLRWNVIGLATRLLVLLLGVMGALNHNKVKVIRSSRLE